MPRVEFEADTQQELLEMVQRWVGPGAGDMAKPPQSADTREEALTSQIREVIHGIKGVDSRKLVRELAEAAIRGDAVILDERLKSRYNKTTGTAFAGIVSGPNKLMRRIARRDLITWDASVLGYRIHPADAKVVLEVWPE